MSMVRTAEWTICEAEKWIEANPEAWGWMKRQARFYANHEMRFSIRELADVVRFRMASEGYSDGFKMNNSLHPVFSRKLLAEVPECKKFLEVRRSKVDGVMKHA